MSDILWLTITLILLFYILLRNRIFSSGSTRRDSSSSRRDSSSSRRDSSSKKYNTNKDTNKDTNNNTNKDTNKGTNKDNKPNTNNNTNNTSDELVVQILVRSDLGMSKGKILSQVMHGISLLLRNNNSLEIWESKGEAKIVLKGDKNDFNTVIERCKSRGVKYYRVYDAGRTQVASGSNTVLVIGPLEKREAALITGSLKLY